MAENQSQNFQKGITGTQEGAQSPSWAIDKYGNAQFSTVNLAGGGTTGLVLDNNEFISGLTTGNAVKRLIGVNASNLVSIDPDGLGVCFPDGTAAAPAIAFTADTNTGIYRYATDTIGFSVAGALSGFISPGAIGTGTDAGVYALGAASDVVMQRDAANVLALKNGTIAQEFRVYGTTTGPKYAAVLNDGTDSYIRHHSATGSLVFTIGATDTAAWLVASPSGRLLPALDNAYALGVSGSRISSIASVLATFSGAVQNAQGADVASASTITLGAGGNTFRITGTTTINLITTTGWQVGSMVNLTFASTAALAHNQTAAGLTAGIIVAGSNGTYSPAANYCAQLILTSNGALPIWICAYVTRAT